MINAILTVVAQIVLRDSELNGVSIINVLEGIQADGFPVIFGPAAFLAIWTRETNDPPEAHGEYTVELDGKRLITSPIVVNFGTGTRNRIIINMQGVVLPGPGLLVFGARAGGSSTAKYEVLVQATAAAV